MKKRNSLVSNSSSASYIVTINDCTIEELRSIANEDLYYELKPETVIEKFQKQLELPQYKNRIPEIQSRLEKYKKADDIEQFITALLLNGIAIEKKINRLELTAHTTMHNSYVENMPPMLQAIVLVLAFESDKNIEYKLDSW